MRRTHKPDRIKDGKFGGMMEVSLLNDVRLPLFQDQSREAQIANGDLTDDVGSTYNYTLLTRYSYR